MQAALWGSPGGPCWMAAARHGGIRREAAKFVELILTGSGQHASHLGGNDVKVPICSRWC